MNYIYSTIYIERIYYWKYNYSLYYFYHCYSFKERNSPKKESFPYVSFLSSSLSFGGWCVSQVRSLLCVRVFTDGELVWSVGQWF